MNGSGAKKNWEEAIRLGVVAELIELRTATPARVESYDAALQKATVTPLLKRKTAGGVVVEHKPIPAVPVHWPRGGGFALTFPLSAGDVGLLIASDRSLDIWLKEGGSVDPQDSRRHSLTDGIFLPGLHHFGDAIPTSSSSNLVLAKEDDSVRIVITPGGEVQIKGIVRLADPAASDKMARADRVDGELSSLKSALAGWTPVSGDGGAALKTILTALFAGPPSWPASTAADDVYGK